MIGSEVDVATDSDGIPQIIKFEVSFPETVS